MPSEEIEKFRIIESRKNYEDADQWLRNFKEATWDEVRTFVRFYMPPGDEMLHLFGLIREWEGSGVKPFEVRDSPSGFLEDDLSVGMAQFRGSLDYLSLVGSTIRPGGYTESLSWGILGRNYFLAPFNEKGTTGGFLTITGQPRMGKSGVACLYGEIWLEEYPETEVLTNVPLDKTVDHVRPVTDVLILLQAISEALIADRRWLWEYDEPSLSGWMKSDAQTRRAKNLERFARIIPKLKGSFIYIEQREEGVPTTIQDFAQSHIYCTNPGNVFADLPGKRGPLRHVPKPKTIKYRTGEAGYFEVPDKFPWDDLFRALRFDPRANIIEMADASTQGQRIQRFLAGLEDAKPKAERPAVSCRFCGESWVPRSDDPPTRCPKCRKVDPLGIKDDNSKAKAGETEADPIDLSLPEA